MNVSTRPNKKPLHLLPCPFCGNTQVTIQPNGIGDYYVRCGDGSQDEGDEGCGARTSDFHCEGIEFAAERWNRRVK